MTETDVSVNSRFTDESRRALAAMTRDFTASRIAPQLPAWEAAGELPRDLHVAAGELGLLGLSYPESVGGSGGDLIDVVVMTESILAAGGSGGVIAGLFTHGISIPHVIDAVGRRLAAGEDSAAEELLDRVVRPTLAGTAITALGVTEPDGGSDVGAIRTTATAIDDQGNPTTPGSAVTWRIDGAKAYITSGARADFVVVAARAFGPGAAGVALFAVPTEAPGFTVVRRATKMGWHCSDTAELSFTALEVPGWALLTPTPGAGFASLARHFAVERISLAVTAYATAQRCLDLTVAWTKERQTFGRPLASRQVVRHDLVEMHRLTDVARTYTRALVADVVASGGESTTSEQPDPSLILRAALAKNTAVAACDAVVATAVQLHGGYGFLRDSEVEMHYRDAKVLGIGGGATEVMTDLAAKLLGY
ncbi:MAG: acyl-CoA dehydrogenase family protein [Actinobacteria bacterium]|nr:acyl-CoA dehydrogenase family protein [Actinomycetota bacterium]